MYVFLRLSRSSLENTHMAPLHTVHVLQKILEYINRRFLFAESIPILLIHCKPKPFKAYRELPVSRIPQGNPYFHYREPLFSLQVPVFITGISCKPLYFPVKDCSVVESETFVPPLASNQREQLLV